MNATGRFEGKVVAVTGAASGMGRATARRMASEGATVFGMDIDADGLDAVRGEAEPFPGTITTRVTDISDPDECTTAIADCVAQHGRLDVLGNFAAISWSSHTADVTPAAFRKMFAINVDGTYFLCQAAIPHLLETNGCITNVASNAAKMGLAYFAPYSATKGAVVQMTKALAMEFVKQPIRINAIAPGGTDTPMNVGMQLPDDLDWDLIKPMMGFREMGKPEEIAALFAFLASEDAANIHGSIMHADSGLTAS